MYWLISTLLLLGGLYAVSDFSERRLEARFPAIGQFSWIAGSRMHYTDSTGADPMPADPIPANVPPLILIHGASTNLRDFHASLAEPLAVKHRVIALDRPGHGYSEPDKGSWPDPAVQADILHELLDKLGAKPAILVGHSWAGSLVLAYMLAYPDAVSGAVLLAGVSHPWTGGVAWYNDLAGIPLLGRLFAHTLPLTAGRLSMNSGIASAFMPNPVPSGYLERTAVELTLRPSNFLANADDVRLLSPFLQRQSKRYHRLHQPLLLITGDSDPIVPAWNHTERLMQQAPNAQLVVLEDTGHNLHHVRTEQVVSFIDKFASELYP